MTIIFSLYLDLIRFLAATAVFLDHVSSYPFTKDVVWWRLSKYGGIAVIIFFLLSGYIIAYVISSRERTVVKYFGSRISRLYSVVFMALLLTFFFDKLGMSFNPEFYGIQKVLWKPESWAGYISSVFFVNEYQVFGFNGILPGTNTPYWSLSFEATYYLIAGLVIFARKLIWIPISILILILAGRTIAALFPIWILGFFLYKTPIKIKIIVPALYLIFLCSSLMILAAPYINRLVISFTNNNFGFWFPYGIGPFNRNLSKDYFVAIAFAINLASAKELFTASTRIYPMIKYFIRWLGSLTFPLYCIHYPAICLLTAISPWKINTTKHLVFICLSTAVLTIVVTPISDSMKKIIRTSIIKINFDYQ